jgi:DNA modification methylase
VGIELNPDYIHIASERLGLVNGNIVRLVG